MSKTARDPAIEVVGLSKQYRHGPLANDNISLQVAPRELFSLIGPNGAGKTTLVSQITGELTPTSGQVRVFGVDVIRQPRKARQLLGIVPQEAGLFAHLNVREHLTYFGRLRGLRSHALSDSVRELIEELGLGQHERKWASQLSGGLKRKLMVGIAMLGHPQAIILDEPTTGLDPQSRRDVWKLIQRCQRQGTAVLLTTHYMEEAEFLSERIGIVSLGQLVALGRLDELHEHVNHRFRLTYCVPDSGHPPERTTLYGRTIEELKARITEMGLEEYDISKTNLEDIYLELTRRPLSEEGNAAVA